ncbi:hypothetical protein [Streptomyces sp. NPDC014894]|uniref:hypothetical protein n=1 Tax=Streptomyces sp. NPDC014894 TaxID=3364931 RepID=UPI0036FDA858
MGRVHALDPAHAAVARKHQTADGALGDGLVRLPQQAEQLAVEPLRVGADGARDRAPGAGVFGGVQEGAAAEAGPAQLVADAARVRAHIDRQEGATVVVGHSYAGAVVGQAAAGHALAVSRPREVSLTIPAAARAVTA